MKLEVINWTDQDRPREAALRKQLEADGFDVISWHDPPGADYTPHTHDHDESMWVVSGEITFGIAGTSYRLQAGDRLMLPGGTVHTAHAGRDGAVYLIGQRRV
jgi:quercetin dioxygenase-like cupin family protein